MLIHLFRLVCLSCVWMLCLPGSARADIYQEFYGSRSLAMGGAHRGIGTSNDTLLLNPAGMAISQRYSVDMQYGYGTGDNINALAGSAVDSKSGPVAGGLAYTRSWGNPSHFDATLNRLAAGFAYGFAKSLAVGATVKTVRGNYTTEAGRQEINIYTATLGATASLGEMLSLGVSWENFIKGTAEEQRLTKPVVGIGLGLHLPVLSLGADMVIDTRTGLEKRLSWHAGGEAVVYEMLALRGGFIARPAEPGRGGPLEYAVSGGLGITSQMAAINISAQRTLNHTPTWEIIGGFALMI